MNKKVVMASRKGLVLELFRATLGCSERYSILVARSREEILEIVRREKPDIVFLDAELPGKQIHRVCQAVKSALPGGETRVILLNFSSPEPHGTPARAASGDECLEILYSPTALLEKTENLLALHG